MDTYKTLSTPGAEILYKEKNSKFFGYAFPISSDEDVKPAIDQLRKQHHGAVHFCYAWQTGTDKISYRANDDGEPANSAGMPIYGQIQSFGVTNVLVVVVRFFGGVKLGVGGLISAYRTAARMALEESDIVERTVQIQFRLRFGYPLMSKVMRVIRERNAEIVSQTMESDCVITISVSKNASQAFRESVESIFGVGVESA